jgi:hypothetical protein
LDAFDHQLLKTELIHENQNFNKLLNFFGLNNFLSFYCWIVVILGKIIMRIMLDSINLKPLNMMANNCHNFPEVVNRVAKKDSDAKFL